MGCIFDNSFSAYQKKQNRTVMFSRSYKAIKVKPNEPPRNLISFQRLRRSGFDVGGDIDLSQTSCLTHPAVTSPPSWCTLCNESLTWSDSYQRGHPCASWQWAPYLNMRRRPFHLNISIALVIDHFQLLKLRDKSDTTLFENEKRSFVYYIYTPGHQNKTVKQVTIWKI